MNEIEVKILEINRLQLENTIIGLGGRKYFEGRLDSIIYDINKKGEFVRLRREGDKGIIIEHKKRLHLVGAKSNEETPLKVYSFEEAKKFLGVLGYKEKTRSSKTRIGYEIPNVGIKFDFDKYHEDLEHIPEFLEIEAYKMEDVFEYAQLLGFGKENCLSIDARELIDLYSPKPSA